MGFKLTGGSGGGGGSLPDYSTTKILYPRKWISGNDVWEVTYFGSLPPYNSEIILLEVISAEFAKIVPIEYSFSRIDASLFQWAMHDGWNIYEDSGNVYLRIDNNTGVTIFVSGVLKYTIHNIQKMGF